MTREEVKRLVTTVDMMLTMHSTLAGRYQRRAQTLELMLLFASIFLVAVTFIDPSVLVYFSISPDAAHVIIGLSSITIFLLSIVALVVNWKGKATEHRRAFEALIPIKSEGRAILVAETNDEEVAQGYSRKASLIMGALTPVPEHQFNLLKARHHQKVMLSKLISNHPGSSVFLLKVCLIYRTNRKAWNPKIPA